jgi:hypothetical protein
VDQGKLDEAKRMRQRALQGYKKALGHEQLNHHLHALNTMENYGVLLADTGSPRAGWRNYLCKPSRV